MHQNYYFLKQLAPKLHNELAHKKFIEAFSQEKDEIILVFAESEVDEELRAPFFIKATLKPNFACLSFPDSFDRARRNSVNLFTDFNGSPVNAVRVFRNERAIGIWFEDGKSLVLKMFGNRSNLIAFDVNGNVQQVFNNKLTGDRAVRLHSLDREMDQSFEAFVEHNLRFEPLFPTFGKLANRHLNELLRDKESAEEKWSIVTDFLEILKSSHFYLARMELVPVLTLFEAGEIQAVYQHPIQALDAFYLAYIRLSGIEKEKAEIIRILKKRIQQTDNYLENTFQKLVELESAVRNDEIANIIMANMHQIPERAEKAELYDFYREQPILVKLKKDWSAQKNAEHYYRKSKNEKIELARLNESLHVREEGRKTLHSHLAAITNIDSLRELRTYIKTHELLDRKEADVPASELFKKVEFLGYIILIGRNAKSNDLLTKKFAGKEDLWLHARDVTGSHVVIKNQPGKNFPSPVIERAAELAAFYSKRKTDSLCPVIVTPKKFVRKPKGLPEGAVIIDKEDVIMVVAKGE